MKKLFVILLITVMLLPVVSLADLPDISGLSEEELLELNHQIQLRLFSEKLVDGVTVPPGIYSIGVDIPAGTYRMEFPQATDIAIGLVMEYDNTKKVNCSYQIGEAVGVTSVGKMELHEGMTLEIDNCTAVFYPYAGLFN